MVKSSKRKAAKAKATVATKREVGAVGKALRALGGIGGGALGTSLGHTAAGSALGTNLGAALSRWLGFGDYQVQQNSIVQKASNGVPMMHKDGQSVVIRHREFITEVKSSTSFTVAASLVLNPGDKTTFPWLSTIANSFQEYKFRGVVFHYIPTSGSAISGTSPSLGSVMLQTSYRSNDAPPSSKSELLNEYWSSESVPCETFVHPVECDPKENPFQVQYVRSRAPPVGDNQLLYDLGVTHVVTSGQLAAGNVIGDLWVTYEVELKKPIVASNVTARELFGAVSFAGATTTSFFNGAKTGDLGNVLITGSGNTITAAGVSGAIIIDMYAPQQAAASFAAGAPTVTNATLIPCFATGATTYASTAYSGAASFNGYGVMHAALLVTDPSKPVTITVGNAYSVAPGTVEVVVQTWYRQV